MWQEGSEQRSAAHQEYNDTDLLAEAKDRLILGEDLFGRDAKFTRVEIDESYPLYLREHLSEYDYLVMPLVSEGQKKYIRLRMKIKRFFRKAFRRLGRIIRG